MLLVSTHTATVPSTGPLISKIRPLGSLSACAAEFRNERANKGEQVGSIYNQYRAQTPKYPLRQHVTSKTTECRTDLAGAPVIEASKQAKDMPVKGVAPSLTTAAGNTSACPRQVEAAYLSEHHPQLGLPSACRYEKTLAASPWKTCTAQRGRTQVRPLKTIQGSSRCKAKTQRRILAKERGFGTNFSAPAAGLKDASISRSFSTQVLPPCNNNKKEAHPALISSSRGKRAAAEMLARRALDVASSSVDADPLHLLLQRLREQDTRADISTFSSVIPQSGDRATSGCHGELPPI